MNKTPLAALVAALAMHTPAAPAAPVRKPMVISHALLAIARGVQSGEISHPARPPRPNDYGVFPELPPGVVPGNKDALGLAMDGAGPVVLATGEAKREFLAMDSAGGFAPAWGVGQSVAGGLWFPGYPYLAELTQISEYREPCELIATEMTRKWFKLQSKSGGDKSEQIAEIMAECERLKVRENFYRAALLDCEFGRGQIYLNIADADETKRQLPLEVSPAGIPKNSLKSIQCFEPYWSTPYSWNAQYPERPDFYKPTSWYIMGRKTHSDRILTFIGREVPDLLKPAYNFSGISMIQLGEMSVNMWLRTRKAVNDLINNFSIPVLATNLAATLEEGAQEGSGLLPRIQAFTALRNNQMVAAVDKDTEELKFAEATLASLDKLQAQSQEHMAAVWGTPLVKLFGVTPAGLGATSEGEITVWYDRVGALQVRLMQPNLEIVLKAVQCSIHGKIDDDLTVHWITLDEPTEKELSEIRKSDAEMDASNINAGIISPDEARVRLQSDPDSGYTNLTGPAPEPPQDVDENGNPIEGNENGDTEPGALPEEDGDSDNELAGFTMDEAKFEESKHKRGPGGQFGSGGHAAAAKPKYDPYRAETQVTVHKEYKFAGQPDDPGHENPASKLDPEKIKAAQAGSAKVSEMMGKGGEKPGTETKKSDKFGAVKPVAASEKSARASQGGASKAPFVNEFMSGHKNREDDMSRLGKVPDEKLKKAYELLAKVTDEDAKYMRELIRDVLKGSK